MKSALSQLALLASSAFGAPTNVRRQAPAGVPSYALDYAPLVYLYTTDPYRPGDLMTQLTNTQPEVNFTSVAGAPSPLTLDNLNALNAYGDNGTEIYLTAIDNVQSFPLDLPEWTFGVDPNSAGETVGAMNCAIIVNDHGNGNVDVFYMYFYNYNWGGLFLGTNLDDHVGDWEHNMIRFSNGVPTQVWFSQHANGEAFTYDCLEKSGLRPIVFSANGSHANYAINGTHDHTIPDLNLPEGLIEDFTDNGPIWDPTLSAYYYTFDADTNSFGTYDDDTPVNWLYFNGGWGDQQYPDSDPNQLNYLDLSIEWRFTSGPTGPLDKQLNRTDVCPDDGDLCIVRVVLGP